MVFSSELRGREEDAEKVTSLLDEVHSGNGRILLVEGGPGTGKTSFLAAAECHARRRGFTILRQRTDGATPGRATTTGGLVEQLEARVAEQAALGPVLVALDDAHRAGPHWQPALAALPALEPPRPVHGLVSILGDKEWPEMLVQLDRVIDRGILTVAPTAASRGWDAAWLRRWLSDASRPPARASWSLVPDFRTALQEAQRGAATILVTGSFHTVGDVMAELGL